MPRCLLTGRFGTGRRTLIQTFAKGSPLNDAELNPDYRPSVIEDAVVGSPSVFTPAGELVSDSSLVVGEPMSLNEFSGGSEYYTKTRPVGYRDRDVILVCFSVVDRASFGSIREDADPRGPGLGWAPELKKYSPGTPFLLVGLKTDLRPIDAAAAEVVTAEEGVALAEEIGASKYLECSAYTYDGVVAVFTEAERLHVLVSTGAVFAQEAEPQASGSSCAVQ